jgi:hypothetical protein
MDTQLLPANVLETLDEWQDRGLEVRELSKENVRQTIEVDHDPLTGKIDVRYTRLDAVQALGLLADSLYAVWKDGFQGDIRPPLNSGHSKVCVELDGDRLLMAFGTSVDKTPVADPVVAKGLLLAALFGLCAEEGEFDSWKALFSQIELKPKEAIV